MTNSIVYFDMEINPQNGIIMDIGAINSNKGIFHSASVGSFSDFIEGAEFLCGHNAVHHDLKYLKSYTKSNIKSKIVDTLYLSPLLFPKKPYHHLLKDDKLQVDELNNPVNDSMKARDLLADEVSAFFKLNDNRKAIFFGLLYSYEEFSGFFDYVAFKPDLNGLSEIIREEYCGLICSNADIEGIVKDSPIELSYALALIGCEDETSITPPWLLHNFPRIENVIKLLRNTPCKDGCEYCKSILDIHKGLKKHFGFDHFRTYDGEPLQENAAQSAVEGKSLLAIFPTGGGKSITFQLPAVISGKAAHGLTVVISPLQSLMKDQVDNLVEKGIENVVAINGMLDPIERAEAIDMVENGKAAILYISPEQLRSRTVEKLLMSRNVVRFVIDEAHCFSAWGQDFRVDYLFIGDFIRMIQENKMTGEKAIPVSCFTATAKQKVITDICEYFKKKLNLDLEIYASSATRENLHYTVLYKETEEEKYNSLRLLIEQKKCPTIVYVSRTKRTFQLAQKLSDDGFPALPFNGKMDVNEKIVNQEAFMNNEVSIIIATSAFGMGVDKSDVKLVVHYDISDSLENYVQEAGRAGRDPSLQAECFVLFNDSDLDKHFLLLNQTKLSISEIQQVWRAIKDLTKKRSTVCCSPLEIARHAGWDDSPGSDMEVRVKTAVAALETAGYLVRGRNVPRIYATGISVKTMIEASDRIRESVLFSESQGEKAKRILSFLISRRSNANAGNNDAESRIDYIADNLGLEKGTVIESINLMRQEGLLDDTNDMSAYIYDSDNEHKSMTILTRFAKLERFLISKFTDSSMSFCFKELNEEAISRNIITSNEIKSIRTILFYLWIKSYIMKEENRDNFSVSIAPTLTVEKLSEKFEQRVELSRFIIGYLYENVVKGDKDKDVKPVEFSMVGLLKEYQEMPKLIPVEARLSDVEDALLYLSKIGALKIEGGFLVLYNGMEIKRLIKDNRIQYKREDYRLLDEFYKQKIQQIHIVGEYANLMVRSYETALKFVSDYFRMDYKSFIAEYFKGERLKEIERNVTPAKYDRLFGELSEKQSEIINDSESKYIVVAAGPGSGKTRVLVHKLASLLLMEDVKHDQLLMVTFSRAAATEFKKRLQQLIGSAANFVEIKTFHSYCFDLLGKIGSLEESENVVRDATNMIQAGKVEMGKITKSVLVIDEAQDMDEHEYALLCGLMSINENMRVIAVGDDDQNIYGFRGSSSEYIKKLVDEYGAKKYELNDNYRSDKRIVRFANSFVKTISERMKTKPIESVSEFEGSVRITRHTCPIMEAAVVKELLAENYSGKTCVLMNTNIESMRVLGLLLKNGRRAKLIQSLEHFHLNDLLEVRAFMKALNRYSETPTISDEEWNSAKNFLFERYKNSGCIDNVKRMILDFESTHNIKYRSDFQEFAYESKFEDFYDDSDETIFVSTIHKSKGREFDNVYMLLKDTRGSNDEERRKLYVGMTRAKVHLSIHTNTDIFRKHRTAGVDYVEDYNFYPEPDEIMMQLTHRDVFLGFFKGRKNLIFGLHSGQKLQIEGDYLLAEVEGRNIKVAKFSKRFTADLEKLQEAGYYPSVAEIRFIVAWKSEEDTEESAVLLPSIKFKKMSSGDEF